MNMFMIFKRKQMILTALVLMLGIAGYLNYRYDKDAQKQIASIENAEITEPGVGETVMVSSEGSPSPDKKSDVKDPFAAHKLRRDAAREKTKEELNNLYNDDKYFPIDGKIVRIADHLSALLEADISIKHGITSSHLELGRAGMLKAYKKGSLINGIDVGKLFEEIVG